MNRHFEISEVVPHSGLMSLLDDIVDYDEESLTASVDIHPGVMFAEVQGVPSWVGIEYMAQTIAAHAGVLQRLNGLEVKVGFLVGTRKLTCSHSYIPFDSKLLVKVEKEFQADNGLGVFNCSIRCGDIAMDAGLNVFQPEDVNEFLENGKI
ncbi:3-hydroxylacyl-ACP dehydratase [Aurantivibrio infirmus]